MEKDIYRLQREEMIKTQLIGRGIKDKRVLKAMDEVLRHYFVSEKIVEESYEDKALPISEKQTISQPYMVALMTELLKLTGEEQVLEIGTGSGYQAAILSKLAKEVYTVERLAELAQASKRIFDKLGLDNIKMRIGDGTKGWQEYSPYDCIMVTAGSPNIPAPLVEQLKINGRMVIPVGSKTMQILTYVEKREKKIYTKDILSCTFVHLIGEEGWKN